MDQVLAVRRDNVSADKFQASMAAPMILATALGCHVRAVTSCFLSKRRCEGFASFGHGDLRPLAPSFVVRV
jgi:hypothetical protein